VIRPTRLLEVPTPALIVDVAALDRNITRMAAFFADGPCRLRPHFKAHKTPEIARRQLAAGSCAGITCATVSEAEVAAELCDDLLIANEIVSADKCARVAALARTVAITVAIDSVDGIAALASAAKAAGVTIGVLVDIDVGQRRCGVAPGDDGVVQRGEGLLVTSPGVLQQVGERLVLAAPRGGRRRGRLVGNGPDAGHRAPLGRRTVAGSEDLVRGCFGATGRAGLEEMCPACGLDNPRQRPG